MTAAAPPSIQRPPPQRPGRSWPWALGALLVVALVWGGSYTAHRVVAARTLAAARVPAPAYPPASLVSLVHPEAGAPFGAPIGDTGRFVLLAGPREESCPPTGACSPTPPLDILLVVDARSGITLAQTPLTGTASQPLALAVDPQRGLADVISTHAVDVYATSNGVHQTTLALPLGAQADANTDALVESDGTLLLTARISGVPALVGMNSKTGTSHNAVIFQSGTAVIATAADATHATGGGTAPTSTATAVSGPVYDAETGFLALATDNGAGETDTTTLNVVDPALDQARATWTLPTGTRLGPLDPTNHTLYFFEPDGATVSATEAALTPAHASPPSISIPPPAPLTAQPALVGARALGWDHARGSVFIADASGLRIADATSGQTIEALPLPVAQTPDRTLSVDEQNDIVYVPTDHGTLAVVQDSRGNRGPANAHGLSAATAALLARAAVAVLPPQNGQDPPFLMPDTFTVGPGTRSLSFYAFDADFGTSGPYPGTATLAIAPVSSQAGVYNATFTIIWNLRFTHTRTWVYQVVGDGAVRLISQAGDGLPCCQTPGQTSG